MCIPPILAGASLEMGAIFLMRRILKPYNWRLIIWRESYATNGESELPLILTSLLTMKRMVVIDADQELLLVSFSHMLRTTTISAETEIHLPKAWEMTRWVKYSTKSPDHLSRTELREGDFTQPMFTMYNGQPDPVKHVSHFNQRMAMHSKNKALMCKIFPSSLRPVAMRWLDGLGANSIDSFKEITQAFGSCFLHAAGFLNL